MDRQKYTNFNRVHKWFHVTSFRRTTLSNCGHVGFASVWNAPLFFLLLFQNFAQTPRTGHLFRLSNTFDLSAAGTKQAKRMKNSFETFSSPEISFLAKWWPTAEFLRQVLIALRNNNYFYTQVLCQLLFMDCCSYIQTLFSIGVKDIYQYHSYDFLFRN